MMWTQLTLLGLVSKGGFPSYSAIETSSVPAGVPPPTANLGYKLRQIPFLLLISPICNQLSHIKYSLFPEFYFEDHKQKQ